MKLDIILDIDEFKTRLELFVHSNSVIEIWDAAINEIIKSTYRWVNLLQAKLLACAIDVIWTTEFTDADYRVVIYRLLTFERQFFPSNKTVRDTIRQLCEKGVVKCKVSPSLTCNPDGTLLRESRLKVLEVSDKFRKECINAMAERLRSSLNGYLLPEKK